MSINRFQTQVATGRFSLPVVILVCLLLWGITLREWSELASLGITAIVGFTLIETNTTFNLIRTRTSMPVCVYWLVATALFFLHPYEGKNWIPLAFIASIFQLFHSYESSRPATSIFHAFLFISLGSLLFPPFMYVVPLLWGSMIPFRSMSGKSFVASLIGLLTPYWFLFGYAVYVGNMQLFLVPLQEMIQFAPIDYSQLTLPEIRSWAFVSLLAIVSALHYGQVSYMDKTRTRIYHSFWVVAVWWTTLLSIFQPSYLHEWISIQLIGAAFLSGHLFTLTRNRFSGIFFIVIFVLFILLVSFNLWMLFFNS